MTWFRSAMVIVLSAVAIIVLVLAVGRSAQEAAVFAAVVTALVVAYLARARARSETIYQNRRAGED